MDKKNNEKHIKIEAGKEKLAAYIRKKGRKKTKATLSEESDNSSSTSSLLNQLSHNDNYSSSISIDDNNLLNKQNSNKKMSLPKEKETEIEEEIDENFSIEENISFGDNSELSLGEPIPLDLNIRKRDLFDIDRGGDIGRGSDFNRVDNFGAGGSIDGIGGDFGEPSRSQFTIDDDLLSGENLAIHFQLPKILQDDNDSLDAALNDIDPIDNEDNDNSEDILGLLDVGREESDNRDDTEEPVDDEDENDATENNEHTEYLDHTEDKEETAEEEEENLHTEKTDENLEEEEEKEETEKTDENLEEGEETEDQVEEKEHTEKTDENLDTEDKVVEEEEEAEGKVVELEEESEGKVVELEEEYIKEKIEEATESEKQKVLEMEITKEKLEDVVENDDKYEQEKIIDKENSDKNEDKSNTIIVVSPEPDTHKSRDISPDDLILINDQKVSINSLKLNQETSQEISLNNQSTTNDISDIIKDDQTINVSQLIDDVSHRREILKKSKSLDVTKLHPNITDRTYRSFDINLLEDEISLRADELSSLDPNINIMDESAMNKLLEIPTQLEQRTSTPNQPPVSLDHISDGDDIFNLKEKINSASKEIIDMIKDDDEKDIIGENIDEDGTTVKQMEKIEFTKEMLEDISEESERALLSFNVSLENKKVSVVTQTHIIESVDIEDIPSERKDEDVASVIEKGQEIRQILQQQMISNDDGRDYPIDIPQLGTGLGQTSDFDSVISLNMFQMMENKVKELQDIIAGKDVCLAALNMQIEAYSRRESLKESRDSLKELPSSGRASSSLATSSTEYRTIQDDYVNKLFDFQSELTERENLIEQLTESLQQSMQMREQLQSQGEKLTTEVVLLRKQLAETLEIIKKPHWMRDQESVGQRISEFSIDLVSETDEESDRNYALEYDGASNRNSTERQLDEIFDQQLFPSLSKEIESFLTYLAPEELRIFNMVQKKFDDFLSQELQAIKLKHDDELKIVNDRLETEKNDRENEVVRLRELLANVKCGSTEIMELRHELEAKHSQEMEDLRTYFERKCSDLEKQYSEEVFSQQSRRHSRDSGSDISDHDILPIEEIGSPLKKVKDDLYSSPTHRKITPTTIATITRKKVTPLKQQPSGPEGDGACIEEQEPVPTIDELKIFYQEKINEINLKHEATVKRIHSRLRQFETRNADDEFIPESTEPDGESINNEQHEFNTIIAEYERRLQEQVALARQDVLNELDIQIQALLSETTVEDSHWPPELILLREKFTAKSQLEIAQLQIKHEEEMARVKTDYEKQLSRKTKRNSTFDSTRDLDEIITERDNLRELSNTLRWLLCELAKYCTIFEDDLNNTFIEELQKYGVNTNNLDVESNHSDDNFELNMSGISTKSLQKRGRFIPDVTGILSIIEEPSLIEFISNNKNPLEFRLNLDDCLERLKTEAMYILKLSENFNRKSLNGDEKKMSDKDDSCEEEDGLKRSIIKKREKFIRAKSLNDTIINGNNINKHLKQECKTTKSLPLFSPNTSKDKLNNNNNNNNNIDDDDNNQLTDDNDDIEFTDMNSELNIKLHELKNRLVKSEDEKKSLELELADVISKHDSLANELHVTKEQLETLEGQKEVFMEGFGANLVSPRHQATLQRTTNLIDLQERAKNILNTSHNQTGENTTLLMQLVEDFCREGDRFMEEGKKDKDDLQAQIQFLSNSTTIGSHSKQCCDKIDAADKQLKGTRHFLEEQAAEREQERDDFTKEIERLKIQLKEREKERNSYERVSKEIETMEHQMKDMSSLVTDYEEKKVKLESDLKASIDKIFVLREIISELENQVETKTLNEHVLQEKIKEIEGYISSQNKTNESLQNEVESLKFDADGRGYCERIAHLEEQLKKSMNSAEQSIALEHITGQLREIEMQLDKKTKTLESLHAAISSVSCSSPSEDVSLSVKRHHEEIQIVSPTDSPRGPISLPVDEVQRILEKLTKHTRAEEAALKRIKDLEMQVGGVRESYSELQRERDLLQEKLTEQLNRISSLQSRLDEQRNRAEELHRQGTSDLNIRVHDLRTEVSNLKETLSSRDKQIATLKEHLEESKKLIDSQEAELAMVGQTEQSDRFELQLKNKIDENQKLKEKIKNEMINKLALPDLMETMLADKNDEIDQLKEQLQLKENELKIYLDLNLDEVQLKELQKTAKEIIEGKLSGRTLSDIVSISSEYDEPDMIRKYANTRDIEGGLTINLGTGGLLTSQQMDSGKIGKMNETFTRSTNEMTIFGMPQTSVLSGIAASGFFQDLSNYPKTLTPELLPRKINFSFADSTNSFGNRKENDKISGGAFIEEIFDDKELSDIQEEDVDKLKEEVEKLRKQLKILPKLETEVESLKLSLESVTNEKNNSIEKLKVDIKIKINEMSNLQIELSAKERLYNELIINKKELETEVDELRNVLNQLEINLKQKENEIKIHLNKITEIEINLSMEKNNDDLLSQINLLNKIITDKDELILKFEKDIIDYATSERLNIERIKELEIKIINLNNMKQLKEQETDEQETDLIESLKKDVNRLTDELTETRRELSEKMIDYEKCKLDLEQLFLPDQTEILNINELSDRLKNEITKNKLLSNEIEKLRNDIERIENSTSPKPFSLDEIAEQVEKELNYSAQLDSSILKAIESDDLNSEDENPDKKNVEELLRQTEGINDDFNDLKLSLEMEIRKRIDLTSKNTDILKELENLKQKYEKDHLNSVKLQTLLDSEKKNSSSIQQQDATIIEAMRIRLEAAIDNESDLQKQLDDERYKCERLSTQISVVQRSSSSNSLPLLKSSYDSPKKSPKSNDFNIEQMIRLESELKFMTSQNEREKERVSDLQRVLERERHRFDKEVAERNDFGERMKKEIDRVLKEKENLQSELEHANERLELTSQEIESLEMRIQAMESSDGKFEIFHGRDRKELNSNMIEIRQLREKLHETEKEKEHLNETIYLLRGDIERGAQRETKLAEALAREASGEGPVPQMFLHKLKETNDLLTENAKENRQMADTLQFLTEERRTLQNRCAELESGLGVIMSPRDDLEERANHLFGKYLKTESFRKALVHQKRYLLIVLATYQENEAKALAMMNGGDRPKRKKRRTFRTIVFLVIAVHRMKFIVRRWQTGKRIGGKAIFSSQMPRRSASATTNNWARSDSYLSNHPNSPPCRDRPYHKSTHSIPITSNMRPLQSPSLITEHHKLTGNTRRLE